MPSVEVNGLELFYETSGDPDGPPLLLIAGLGGQLIDWPDDFLGLLHDHGLHVIRFDNRDIGLSTTFEGGQSDPQVVFAAMLAGEDPGVAYTLADMADDAAGLLAALGIESVHVVGMSMGAMVAQCLALDHREVVRSLTSIMSTTGAPDVGQPTAEAMDAILSTAPGTDRAEIIAHNIEKAITWASPEHIDRDRLQQRFDNAWDRAGGSQGENAGRQFCAIMASAPRDQALRSLDLPALVIHGTADTLISPDGGQRTADLIGGSTLVKVEGMGHDLMPAFVPEIVTAITVLVDGASSR